MKKNNKSFKRQFLSGTVYVALAAVVVAVTINTTVGIISDKTKIPHAENISGNTPDLPDITELPELSLPEFSMPLPDSGNSDTAVSDTAEGINSDIIEEIPSPVISPAVNESTPQNISKDPLSIPENADLGFDKFVKPCNGFVLKEHSVEIPVYSATMSDYRTHTGIDVAEELGCEVVCVSGGIVTDIYNDDLYGTTVKIKNRDDYTIVYSNLMPTLATEIEVGKLVKTAEPVGGIGETAICEAVETPHLHLEIYDSDGNAIDPEDLISF